MADLTPMQRMIEAAQRAVEEEKAKRAPLVLPAPPDNHGLVVDPAPLGRPLQPPVRPRAPSQPPARPRTPARPPRDDTAAWRALVDDVGGEEATYILAERAAIMEYDGGMPRPQAESAARECVLAGYR